MDKPLMPEIHFPFGERKLSLSSRWNGHCDSVLVSDITGIPETFTPVRGEAGVYYAQRNDVPRDGKWEVSYTAGTFVPMRDGHETNTKIVRVRRVPEPETEWVHWYEARGRETPEGQQIIHLHWWDHHDEPRVVATSALSARGSSPRTRPSGVAVKFDGLNYRVQVRKESKP